MAVLKLGRDVLKKYYCPRSACQVLGCLMNNPKLLKSKAYPIISDYFATKNHKVLFEVIEALADNGLNEITLADIESWMAQNSAIAYNRFFEMSDESEWILGLIEDANLGNYEHYYNTVRKYSYLRDKLNSGQDVSDILDESEIDTALLEQQREAFSRMSLHDIMKYYDTKNISIKQRYSLRSEADSRKAGDGAKELFESFKQKPMYGWRSESKFLDTISYGCRRKMFVVESKDSGTGKTRLGVKQLCVLSCDTLWNHVTKRYEPNPYGATVPTLYIGTEMDLYREIEPIIWATISGVDEDKIKNRAMGTLTDEELERVEQAIEIAERSPIFLENEPNYDVQFFWSIVDDHRTKNNIGAVVIDYIEMTPNLASEYVQATRGMSVREDQILFNLSTQLKYISNEMDVFVKAYTQISEDARRDERIRDSGAIKGSKSLQMRADLAIVTMRPTEKELKMVEEIYMSKGMTEPNIVLHVYKNRGGKIVMAKVWGYQDLGSMDFRDLFVTDWNYKQMNIKMSNLKFLQLEEDEEEEVEQPKIEKPKREKAPRSRFSSEEEEEIKAHIVGDDELPFEYDPETGEIIDPEPVVEKKASRVSRRKRKE